MTADRAGVAGTEDRLREDDPDAPTVRPRQTDRQHEELGRRIGVRPSPTNAGAAARRRRGELRQVRRIAEHDVVRAVAPVSSKGVRNVETDAAEGCEGGAGVGDGHRVDVDAVQVGDPPGGSDVVRCGGEEATVTARRIEDADVLAGDDRWHHGLER